MQSTVSRSASPCGRRIKPSEVLRHIIPIGGGRASRGRLGTERSSKPRTTVPAGCLNLRSAVFDSRHWSLGRTRGDARRVVVAAHNARFGQPDDDREQLRSGQRAVEVPNTRVSCMDDTPSNLTRGCRRSRLLPRCSRRCVASHIGFPHAHSAEREAPRSYAGNLSPLCAMYAVARHILDWLRNRLRFLRGRRPTPAAVFVDDTHPAYRVRDAGQQSNRGLNHL